MKIIALQAENIKKLVAVEIKPDGNLVQITGRNGAGKSSVLDSIWWALAGTSTFQKEPIRQGQERGRIRLNLGEIVVTRTFRKKEDGETTSSITVENAQGAKFPSPQSVLDGLIGELSFDPLAFSRMADREQFDILRGFVPGVDFEAIEAANKADFDKRTDINRRAKAARASADMIEFPEDTPDEPVDQSALMDEMERAASHNADIQKRQVNRARVAKTIEENGAKMVEIVNQIDQLNRQLHALQVETNDLKQKLEAAPKLPEQIDIAAIRAKLDAAKQINDNVTLRKTKAEHVAEAESLEKESYALTGKIDGREREKRRAIAGAKLPVKSLSFGNGQILMNDVPFDQASDAEKIRASVAISMALNPKLRVIRIRDGSLLDDTSMKIIEEMAKASDYQIWIERVDGSGKVGFVMEDGLVKQEALAAR